MNFTALTKINTYTLVYFLTPKAIQFSKNINTVFEKLLSSLFQNALVTKYLTDSPSEKNI